METQSLIARNDAINDIQARNKLYLCDILLIFIISVDLMTDFSFPVLFYLNGNQQLFIWCLIIFPVTQITYAATMILRLQTATNNNKSILYWIFIFILLLLFGHIFSFIVYFTEYHQQSWTVQLFQKTKLHYLIKQNYQQMLQDEANSRSLWFTKNKLQHMLYLMEAIIASLPHFVMQICGIYVYQISDNYNIPTVLILLAILSITSKLYLISPGIDAKTRIWTWLCILADLFFTVWIICPTSTLPSYSIIVLILLRLVVTCTVALLILFAVVIKLMVVIETSADRYFENKYVKRAWMFLFFLFITICGEILMAATICFCTMCFYVFIALLLYYGSTMRWRDYTNPNVNAQINSIIKFISNANHHIKNDRIIRIIIAHYYTGSKPKKYSFKTPERKEEIRYQHIRNESAKYPKIANIYPVLYDLFRYLIDNITTADISKFERCICLFIQTLYFLGGITFVLSIPFPIILPYIMVGSLIDGKETNSFQLILLFASFGFQLLLLLLGISVFRTHWWLWHICCGEMDIELNHNAKTCLNLNAMQQIQSWYNHMFYPEQVDKIILTTFGNDIGCIILEYIWPNNDIVLQMISNDNLEQLKGKEITYDSDSECKHLMNRHINHGKIINVDARSETMLIKDTETGAYGCYHLCRITDKYKNSFCDFQHVST